jgi:hypothetical protein
MAGPDRQARHGTAHAVGWQHPPGFKSPILRHLSSSNVRASRSDVTAVHGCGGSGVLRPVWQTVAGGEAALRPERSVDRGGLPEEVLRFPGGAGAGPGGGRAGCVYYSPDDTREAGSSRPTTSAADSPGADGHYDLTVVSQRWLRNMLWDHLAGLLRSLRCPRSRSPFDNYRRAAAELSAFLEADAPEGGHDPALLREEHAQRFAADLLHRVRHGLAARGPPAHPGQPAA